MHVNTIRLGSDWGGWEINPSLIRNNSYVISAGLAHDITFDLELLRLNEFIHIIGIDPTSISKHTVNNMPHDMRKRYSFINKAIHSNNDHIKIGGPANSILTSDSNYITCETVTLNDVISNIDVSLLKMDIEGSEYAIIDSIDNISIDQICIEWHHWLGNKYTVDDTIRCINKIINFGYTEVIRSTNEPYRVIQESLFIRNNLL